VHPTVRKVQQMPSVCKEHSQDIILVSGMSGVEEITLRVTLCSVV
jgi:hypothetical protein